ncbi:hypothetical protein LCGC14_2676860 [marine sediment metagenome]|uniref:Uncharacterized protein n=1 Tax=marine sediment metagenome TaxID=412755 RepID=A0A0F9BXG2_9ZZZZ
MELEIKITDYTKDVKGFKIATCDAKISSSPEKWRKFNRLAVFHKENRFWISTPSYMKEDVWVKYYDMDKESYDAIFPHILKKLEKEYI